MFEPRRPTSGYVDGLLTVGSTGRATRHHEPLAEPLGTFHDVFLGLGYIILSAQRPKEEGKGTRGKGCLQGATTPILSNDTSHFVLASPTLFLFVYYCADNSVKPL